MNQPRGRALARRSGERVSAPPARLRRIGSVGVHVGTVDVSRSLFATPFSVELEVLLSSGIGMPLFITRGRRKGDSEKEQEVAWARAMVAREYPVEHFSLDDTQNKNF